MAAWEVKGKIAIVTGAGSGKDCLCIIVARRW